MHYMYVSKRHASFMMICFIFPANSSCARQQSDLAGVTGGVRLPAALHVRRYIQGYHRRRAQNPQKACRTHKKYQERAENGSYGLIVVSDKLKAMTKFNKNATHEPHINDRIDDIFRTYKF